MSRLHQGRAHQHGAEMFAATREPGRGGPGPGACLWYIETPGLSLSSGRASTRPTGAGARTQDCLYREALRGVGSGVASACDADRTEFERIGESGLRGFSAPGPETWSLSPAGSAWCVWNIPLTDCCPRNWPKLTGCWYRNKFGARAKGVTATKENLSIMKPAAIYARVSSDRQKEEQTIASQTSALIERAQQEGYAVPKEWVFEDEGYSGAVLNRPGLERLRDLAAEGQIQAVWVYAPDRLSRKYAYQVLLVEEFTRAGVDVLFIRAPTAQTPEEELLLQFQGMIAEYERAQIAERTRRGKRYRAKTGSVNVLSGAPYGYRYVRKTETADAYYQVLESEAEIVRTVFRLYTQEGLSINAIARWLNDHAVPTRKGLSRWCRSTVWAMLRNPAYRGTACFGKTEQAPRQKITRPLRQRGGFAPRCSASHERPRQEWIEIPVPPLVSEECFALAQEQLEHNKRHAPRRTIEPTLLQGMLVCKQCGYAYYRTSTRTSKRKLYYYRCLGSDDYRYSHGRVCDNRPIRQDHLDQVVWRQVMKLLEDPRLIQDEIDRRIQAIRESDPTKRREATLRKEQVRLQSKIGRLLDAYQEELLSLEELRNRMAVLRKQEQTIHGELQSLEAAALNQQTYLRLADSIETFLSRLRAAADTLSVTERQKILRLLVKEILVDRDTITIRHSVPVEKPDSPAGPSGGAKLPGYLLRSGSRITAARQRVPTLRLRSLGRALETARSQR